jgi:hypothetical protein
MPSKEEPVKYEVKHYIPCLVMKPQLAMKLNNTNHAQNGTTSET